MTDTSSNSTTLTTNKIKNELDLPMDLPSSLDTAEMSMKRAEKQIKKRIADAEQALQRLQQRDTQTRQKLSDLQKKRDHSTMMEESVVTIADEQQQQPPTKKPRLTEQQSMVFDQSNMKRFAGVLKTTLEKSKQELNTDALKKKDQMDKKIQHQENERKADLNQQELDQIQQSLQSKASLIRALQQQSNWLQEAFDLLSKCKSKAQHWDVFQTVDEPIVSFVPKKLTEEMQKVVNQRKEEAEQCKLAWESFYKRND